MNRKYEKFSNDIYPFLEAKLMDILYETDDICVVNVANKGYCIFGYNDSLDGQWGLFATEKMVRDVIENPKYLYYLINSLDKKSLSTMIIALNDKNFKVVQEMKKKTDINGPSKLINFDFEEEIKNMNSKGRGK